MEIILNTYGTHISKDHEAFVVTHKDGIQRLYAHQVDRIIVSKSCLITSDVILFAIEKEIDILFLDRSGQVKGRVWSSRFGSISTIRKGQLNFVQSADAPNWIKALLIHKIENQQALLLTLQTDDLPLQRRMDSAIHRMGEYLEKINALEAGFTREIAPTLRAYEGAVSKIYFDRINAFLPDSYRFEKRSQNPAMDVTNALLNYGYGMLYGKIEGALIQAGVDPFIGVFHRDEYNRPALTYDMIEKYRVWVDYVVCILLSQNCVSDEYFSHKSDGSVWLEALGRRVLIQSMNDYLDEPIKDAQGLQRSRATHIDLYAQQLATLFKKYA